LRIDMVVRLFGNNGVALSVGKERQPIVVNFEWLGGVTKCLGSVAMEGLVVVLVELIRLVLGR
jgi:hypothetical protein